MESPAKAKTIEKYLGEDLIEAREYGSLKELNDNELSNLAFDELVVVEDAQIEEYKQKHDMVIPEMVEAPKPKPKPIMDRAKIRHLRKRNPKTMLRNLQNNHP